MSETPVICRPASAVRRKPCKLKCREAIRQGGLKHGLRESRRLAQRARLIELVVERFHADAQFFGRLGLVAVVTPERLVNRLHLQLAQLERGRGPKRDRSRSAA